MDKDYIGLDIGRVDELEAEVKKLQADKSKVESMLQARMHELQAQLDRAMEFIRIWDEHGDCPVEWSVAKKDHCDSTPCRGCVTKYVEGGE